MTKDEFLKNMESKLLKLEKDFLYNNYSKQLLAYKLGADISRTYKLDYLWQKTLFAISSSCFLLEDNLNSKIALKSLYKVAITLENIAEISDSKEKFDVDFLKILSALCYDVSGYQANAYCIAKKIQEYRLSTELDYNLDEDNFIIQLLLNALLKKIPAIKQMVVKKLQENIAEAFEITLKAFNAWTNQILNLSEDSFLSLFEQSYSLYLKSGNIYISQLLLLFITRIKMYNIRSINLKLKNIVDENAIWKKYIKLLSNDYFEVHGKIKDIEKKKSIFEFWTSQIRAIDDGLLSKNESFVVQMPTSAGKTFIAELFILRHLIDTQKKVLYISPFRALASEKISELGKYFSYLGYKVSSSTGSYEYDPTFDSVFKDTDIFIFTPEKADSVFRTAPNFFEDIAAIVVDEGHIVGDLNYRAALAEMLLIKLKIKYPNIRTLFISAVMPPFNASEYAKWLSKNEENVLRSKLFSDSNINEEWEPTRKNIGYFEWTTGQDGKPNGRIQFTNVRTDSEKPAFVPYYLRGDEYGLSSVKKKPETAAALGIKLAETGNTLIFCGQVRRIKTVSNKFETIFQRYPNGVSILIPNKNKESYFYSALWYGEEHWITKSILYGVGVHFGDMPEQVRSAVENDYKAQKLKIILCTNTIGQGVNFPIKNIIFYDIAIGFSNKQDFISHRDFWNIIGRAGRAEKETEGNIIFIINSKADRKNYENFIKRDNIENSNSILSFALKMMIESRLSELDFDSLVLDIAETFLLDMITEEVFENDSEFIESIIKNSLFNVQVNNETGIKNIRTAFHKAISKIKENDENGEELEEFGKTGLNLKDNKTILAFINENIEPITNFIETQNIESFINIFLELLTGNEIDALKNDYKLNKLVNESISWDKYQTVILAWLHNEPIAKIKIIWSNDVKSKFDDFYTLLSKGLYYLFPWICNAIILLSAYVLKKDYFDLGETIRYIPMFMKYGLDNKVACVARMCGIKSRETALCLPNQSNKTSDKEFISWLANLQKQEIDAMPLFPFEKENIADVVFSIAPSSNKNNPTHFSFDIVGTKYEDSWKKISLYTEISDTLELQRDKENEYDPFAVLVMKNNSVIGYVPREYAKYIATEMDLNNSYYVVKILNTKYVKNENYNIITVSVDLLDF